MYKIILQLFFNEYEKTQCKEITSFKKMLNKLLDMSKKQFLSFNAKPEKVNQSFQENLRDYQHERDDYIIAANALLTLLRGQALSLNLQG